jgi:hypothetical protein
VKRPVLPTGSNVKRPVLPTGSTITKARWYVFCYNLQKSYHSPLFMPRFRPFLPLLLTPHLCRPSNLMLCIQKGKELRKKRRSSLHTFRKPHFFLETLKSKFPYAFRFCIKSKDWFNRDKESRLISFNPQNLRSKRASISHFSQNSDYFAPSPPTHHPKGDFLTRFLQTSTIRLSRAACKKSDPTRPNTHGSYLHSTSESVDLVRTISQVTVRCFFPPSPS